MRSPTELTALFRAHRLKITPQRQAVFAALHGDDAHPTAEVIWARVRERMPNVSLRTVYQALNDLVQLGEAQAISVGKGPSRFDPNTAGHDHFVCRRCERVDDVIASQARLVSAYPGGDASTNTYTVDTAEVIFRGLCALCAAEASTNPKTPIERREQK
jgi:Fur family peroxide stress response transcriptional regulator